MTHRLRTKLLAHQPAAFDANTVRFEMQVRDAFLIINNSTETVDAIAYSFDQANIILDAFNGKSNQNKTTSVQQAGHEAQRT